MVNKQFINDILDELVVSEPEQKLRCPLTDRKYQTKNRKLVDIWNRKTRSTTKEEISKALGVIMKHERIKKVMENTLEERFKEFMQISNPNTSNSN